MNKSKSKRLSVRQLMMKIKKLTKERKATMKRLAEKDMVVEKLIEKVKDLSHLTHC